MTAAAAVEFVLPPEREARRPPEARGLRRDEVRLMVSFRATGEIVHARFSDLPTFLRPGDVLVVNDSATLPAALRARRADGTEIALHLSSRLPAGLWVVEPRNVEVREDEVLTLPGGATAKLVAPYPGSARLWIARLDWGTVPWRQSPGDSPRPVAEPSAGELEYLRRWGRPIAYPYVEGEWPIEMYQNVYARRAGSAEMPSAGRAFTGAIVQRLRARGVGIASVTLHTGVASLEGSEPPYEEWYEVPHETAEAVRAAKDAGGRLVAVGTTVVRALESAVDGSSRVVASRGWTDLIVTPQRGVRVVDGLLTGFHEPRATHLAMLEAIVGPQHLRDAYRTALDAGYLWHEFGDLHLIL